MRIFEIASKSSHASSKLLLVLVVVSLVTVAAVRHSQDKNPTKLLRRHVVRRVHVIHVRVQQRLLEDVRPADRRDVDVLVRLLASDRIQQLPAVQLRRRRIKASSTLMSR